MNHVGKCQFGTTIDYLGHHIPSQGAFPLPAKVFPQPTTVKGLQQFAGMMNFYHRFVTKAAHIMRPIYDALVGKPTNLEWTEELQQAFTAAKRGSCTSYYAHAPTGCWLPTSLLDTSGTSWKAARSCFTQTTSL